MEDGEEKDEALKKMRQGKKPLFLCCSAFPLYYMKFNRLGIEIIKLLFRVGLGLFLTHEVTAKGTTSCEPFFRMYLLVDPWVSVVMQLVNILVVHDRESLDHDLGLEILQKRQRNFYNHFCKLFNHLDALKEVKEKIESRRNQSDENMKASRKFAIEYMKKYFPDPLENPLTHIDEFKEEQADKDTKELIPFVDILDSDQQKTLIVMYPEKQDGDNIGA